MTGKDLLFAAPTGRLSASPTDSRLLSSWQQPATGLGRFAERKTGTKRYLLMHLRTKTAGLLHF